MSPDRAFLIWLSTRQHMIVKKHRAELRAHLMKALVATENNAPAPAAEVVRKVETAVGHPEDAAA